MASNTNTETDQAIKQLTDQIAKLSINLAQQQQPPQPQPQSTNYAATPNTSRPQAKNSCRCYYCGHTGHFIAECRTRQADQ